MLQVILRRRAQKELQSIPPKFRQRIVRALKGLQEDPISGKPLTGTLSGYRSLRIWPYRVIYAYMPEEELVYVVRIGHRQGVYG